MSHEVVHCVSGCVCGWYFTILGASFVCLPPPDCNEISQTHARTMYLWTVQWNECLIVTYDVHIVAAPPPSLPLLVLVVLMVVLLLPPVAPVAESEQ